MIFANRLWTITEQNTAECIFLSNRYHISLIEKEYQLVILSGSFGKKEKNLFLVLLTVLVVWNIHYIYIFICMYCILKCTFHIPNSAVDHRDGSEGRHEHFAVVTEETESEADSEERGRRSQALHLHPDQGHTAHKSQITVISENSITEILFNSIIFTD